VRSKVREQREQGEKESEEEGEGEEKGGKTKGTLRNKGTLLYLLIVISVVESAITRLTEVAICLGRLAHRELVQEKRKRRIFCG